MVQRAATPDDRLRMLRDCGAVIAPSTDFVFKKLVDRGLVRKNASGVAWKSLYRLTDRGRIAAQRLGPFA